MNNPFHIGLPSEFWERVVRANFTLCLQLGFPSTNVTIKSGVWGYLSLPKQGVL